MLYDKTAVLSIIVYFIFLYYFKNSKFLIENNIIFVREIYETKIRRIIVGTIQSVQVVPISYYSIQRRGFGLNHTSPKFL